LPLRKCHDPEVGLSDVGRGLTSDGAAVVKGPHLKLSGQRKLAPNENKKLELCCANDAEQGAENFKLGHPPKAPGFLFSYGKMLN
jgi:hypothetical protein